MTDGRAQQLPRGIEDSQYCDRERKLDMGSTRPFGFTRLELEFRDLLLDRHRGVGLICVHYYYLSIPIGKASRSFVTLLFWIRWCVDFFDGKHRRSALIPQTHRRQG